MKPLLTALVLVLGAPVLARADEAPPPPHRLLMIPIAAGEGLASQELAEAVTDQLAETIGDLESWEVVRFDAAAPAFADLDKKVLEHPAAAENVVALTAAAEASASLAGSLSADGMTITLDIDLRAAEQTIVRSAASRASVSAREGEVPRALRDAAAKLLVTSAVKQLRPALERIANGETEPIDRAIDEHISAGRELMLARDYQQAVAEFQAALAIDPHCESCLVALGEAYRSLRQYADAIDALRRALQEDPGDVAARVNLALAYEQAEDPDNAIKEYQAVINRQPGYLFARIRLAGLYAALGRDASAIEQYQQIVTADPDNTKARLALMELAIGVGRRELALAQLDGIARLRRSDRDAAARVARRLIDDGELTEGIALLALAYGSADEKVGYTDADYRHLAAALDREAMAVDRRGLEGVADEQAGRIGRGALLAEAQELHNRSSRLVSAAEHIAPPESLAEAHAQRLLAYSLLNQSDYELSRYARDEAQDALTRAAMLRQSAQDTLPKR